MDNELYDYRKYDQVWKRVNPQENPYPEARGSAAAPAVSTAPAAPEKAPTARAAPAFFVRHLPASARP